LRRPRPKRPQPSGGFTAGTSQRDVPTNTITTAEVYAFERELEKLHPDRADQQIRLRRITRNPIDRQDINVSVAGSGTVVMTLSITTPSPLFISK
jgi:hypothetical protein